MPIGENIKTLRDLHKVKQKDLAAYLKINGSNISNWESGKITPPLKELESLAAFFNLSLDTLVNGDIKDFTIQNYYAITDYSSEAKRIFRSLDSDEQNKLLRTMYDYKIKHDRSVRPLSSFTDQQFIALYSASSNIILQEFARYIQKIVTLYDSVPDEKTKNLMSDVGMYMAEGQEQSKEFETLIRDIIELLFRPSFFENAYANGNFTIEHLSKQFKIMPEFTLIALNYYRKVYGDLFTHRHFTIDLSNLPPVTETDFTKKIEIYPSK